MCDGMGDTPGYGGDLITFIIISVGRGREVVTVRAQVRPVLMLQPAVHVDSVPVIEHDVPVTLMGVVATVRAAVVCHASPGVTPYVTGHWLTHGMPQGPSHPVVAGVALVARRTGVGGLLPDGDRGLS